MSTPEMLLTIRRLFVVIAPKGKKSRARNLQGSRKKNYKGRDIGYALAVGSCEGASSVEACTVTAPDVITAFAVPNPNFSSQSQSVFSGLVVRRVAPPVRITQPTSDWPTFYF
jgi:hypothetical protein